MAVHFLAFKLGVIRSPLAIPGMILQGLISSTFPDHPFRKTAWGSFQIPGFLGHPSELPIRLAVLAIDSNMAMFFFMMDVCLVYSCPPSRVRISRLGFWVQGFVSVDSDSQIPVAVKGPVQKMRVVVVMVPTIPGGYRLQHHQIHPKKRTCSLQKNWCFGRGFAFQLLFFRDFLGVSQLFSWISSLVSGFLTFNTTKVQAKRWQIEKFRNVIHVPVPALRPLEKPGVSVGMWLPRWLKKIPTHIFQFLDKCFFLCGWKFFVKKMSWILDKVQIY